MKSRTNITIETSRFSRFVDRIPGHIDRLLQSDGRPFFDLSFCPRVDTYACDQGSKDATRARLRLPVGNDGQVFPGNKTSSGQHTAVPTWLCTARTSVNLFLHLPERGNFYGGRGSTSTRRCASSDRSGTSIPCDLHNAMACSVATTTRNTRCVTTKADQASMP